jgi:hypothetical protein
VNALGKAPAALQLGKHRKAKRGPDKFGGNAIAAAEGEIGYSAASAAAAAEAAEAWRDAEDGSASDAIEEGRWVWPNGDRFEGAWNRVLQKPTDQASARMRWAGGDVYEGPWCGGHPSLGVVTWRARYVGDFKYGQEDGLGRYTWRDRGTGRDGNEWDGEWRRGALTFRGVYTRHRDGAMWFENQWVVGCEKHPHRIGVVVTPFDGVEHVGEYCWDGGMVESVDEHDLFFAHRVGDIGKKCGGVCLLLGGVLLLWWLGGWLLSLSEEAFAAPGGDPYFTNKTHLSLTALDPATVVADDDRALPTAPLL